MRSSADDHPHDEIDLTGMFKEEVQIAHVPDALASHINELANQRDQAAAAGEHKTADQRDAVIVEMYRLVFPPLPEGLAIDLDKMTISLGAQTWPCKSENALLWLEVLNDHRGEWISAANLPRYNCQLQGVRPRDCKKHLPDEVQAMIESSRNKKQGSRLKP